jgi:hypothetical protein
LGSGLYPLIQKHPIRSQYNLPREIKFEADDLPVPLVPAYNLNRNKIHFVVLYEMRTGQAFQKQQS